MIAVIVLICVFRDRLRNSRHEKNLRLALALVMIITEMSYFWRLVGVPSLGANPQDHLPITLCGWGVIFASYMLVTKNQTLFDIPYFWLFSIIIRGKSVWIDSSLRISLLPRKNFCMLTGRKCCKNLFVNST